MTNEKLIESQKKADFDLWIIIITTLAVLGLYILLQDKIKAYINNERLHILIRTFIAALFQFGLAGLGITIVSVFRKESFCSYGLKTEKTFLSVALCIICFIPYIVFVLVTEQKVSYLPFQSVWTTNELLTSAFPVNIIGISIIAIVWGFFEGFNYVVISEKINKRYPSSNKWFNWGAIVCAVVCIFIHGMIGITPAGIIQMLTVMIIIYGMLMVKEYTGNAWGCIFIFVFLWNAF